MIKSQKISHAAFYLVIIGIVSTFLGFLRELFLAYKFGASGTTDSYLVAITPLTFLIYLVKTGEVPFVSKFSKDLTKDKDKAWLFVCRIMNLFFLIFLVLSLVFLIFNTTFIKLLAPGFDAQKINLAVTIAKITVPAILLFPLFIFLKGILNSYKQFTWPEAASLFPNIGAILGILCLSMIWGIKGVALGLVVGYIIQFLIPSIKLMPLFTKNYFFSISLRDPEIKKFFLYVFFALLITASLNIDIIADKIFVSPLGTGNIAALNFARKITTSVYFLIAYALSTTFLPYLSRAQALGDKEKFKKMCQNGLRFIIFILLPCSLLIFLLRNPIVVVLFKHGIFSEHDISITTSALAIYALTIVAFACINFLIRIVYSLDSIKIPALIGILMMGLNIFLDFILVRIFSFLGVALATLIVVNLNFFIMIIYLQIKFKIFKLTNLFKFIFKIILASFFMVSVYLILTIIIRNPIVNNEFINNLLYLLVFGGIGVIVFLIASYLLKIEEIYQLKNILFKFKNKLV